MNIMHILIKSIQDSLFSLGQIACYIGEEDAKIYGCHFEIIIIENFLISVTANSIIQVQIQTNIQENWSN